MTKTNQMNQNCCSMQMFPSHFFISDHHLRSYLLLFSSGYKIQGVLWLLCLRQILINRTERANLYGNDPLIPVDCVTGPFKAEWVSTCIEDAMFLSHKFHRKYKVLVLALSGGWRIGGWGLSEPSGVTGKQPAAVG